MTKQRPLLAKLAGPIFMLAVIVCGVSGWQWWRQSATQRHLARAEAFVRERKGPQAEAEWLAVVKAEPGNGPVWELLGEYYLSRSNWPKAEQSFRRLEAVAPRTPHIQCRLAACLLRQDDQQTAFTTAQDELKRDPNCVAALGIVTVLMAQRPNSEVKQQLEYTRRLARLQPDDLLIQQNLAQILSNQFQYDEMRVVCAHILQLAPQDAGTYNLIGFADLARPDQPQGAKDAATQFARSLKYAPDNNGGAHFGMGRALLAQGDTARAVPELEAARVLLSANARVWNELAKAYRKNRQPAQATAAQSRALALQHVAGQQRMLTVRCIAYPDNPHYPHQLGDLYVQTGEYSKAIYYYQKAARLRPTDAELKHNIETLNGMLAQNTSRIPQ